MGFVVLNDEVSIQSLVSSDINKLKIQNVLSFWLNGAGMVTICNKYRPYFLCSFDSYERNRFQQNPSQIPKRYGIEKGILIISL